MSVPSTPSSEESLDRLLAGRAATGDIEAFAGLVRRNLASLRSFLRRLGAPPDLADDLAQDAMVAAFERIADYRGDGAFGGWVRRIAARRYLRTLRASRRFESLDEAPEAYAPAPDTGRRLDLDAALARLPEAQRLCVSLQHGAGYTGAEIASALSLPEGTVKSHIARGLERLRQDLGTP